MIILSLSNVSKYYGANEILKDISFSVEDKEKIGLIGLNGSGKTTLFNILANELSRDSGDIYIRKGLKIGYLKQHTSISSQETIYEECLKVFKPLIQMEKALRELENKISEESKNGQTDKLDSLMKEYAHMLEKFNELNGYGYKSEIKGVLKGLGFSEEDMDKKIDILSGGQKARVSLAKLLLTKPDLILLDEPTNHLDIEATEWLESYIRD